MNPVATLTLVLPCPSCQVRRPLASAQQLVAPEGSETCLLLHECVRCWKRRALALNEARQVLKARGELRDAHGVLTWHGERLHDGREQDGLTGALASEMLRRDIPAAPAARLRLPAAAVTIEQGASRG